jgi:membrane protein required for colicin V production
MEINYFDIIIGGLIVLLGLKGIFNGFFKELFGLIGIIGGIFIASRFGDQVGEYLSKTVFHFTNSSATNFTGFIVTLILFWILMIIAGYGFKKLSALSGLGMVDRIFGFIFATGKFFLIAAVIAFAVNNVKALQPTLHSTFQTSKLFPVLVEVGGYIMKIDTTQMSKEVSKTVNDVKEVSNKVSQKIQEKTQEAVNTEVSKKIKENVEEIQKKLTNDDKEEEK